MRVLALTFGDTACASSFYRVYQFVGPLRELGIHLRVEPAKSFARWDTVSEYDAVLVQKRLFSSGRVRWLRRKTRLLIYDVDDAIWFPANAPHHWLTRWRTHRRVAAVASSADLCLVSNKVLGGHLQRWSRNVIELPMALTGTQWPARTADVRMEKRVRVGWAGGPGSLAYLESFEPIWLALRRRLAHMELAVFSGARPRFKQLTFEYLPYEPGAESAAIRTFDVGLLPLPDSQFADGKSPIKGLQYMASAVPCVASPTGGVREMFPEDTAMMARTEAEWLVAVSRLVEERDFRRQMGLRARAEFESRYEIGNRVASFAKLLRSAGPAK